MQFDLGAIVTSLLASLGITSAAWGRMKARVEHLEEVVSKNSQRLHDLANAIHQSKIEQANGINGLRKEMHEDFVTYRQLEDLKAGMAEARDDIKKLLEMVAIMNARHLKKGESWE